MHYENISTSGRDTSRRENTFWIFYYRSSSAITLSDTSTREHSTVQKTSQSSCPEARSYHKSSSSTKQQESTSREKPELTRASIQKSIQQPIQKSAGKVLDRLGEAPAQITALTATGQPPRRYGQAIRKSASTPEPDRRVSLLPIRVTDRSSTGNLTGLAARRPIWVTPGPLSRDPARTMTQANVRKPVETPTPPLTTPCIDIPLALNQEVIVRVGQQSLSMRNVVVDLALRFEDGWRLLDEIVSNQLDLKQISD